jgi:histidyl-tRNA synthetase
VNAFGTSPGTRDILPPDAERWRAFQARFADAASRSGFDHVIPPMFEDLGVFLRLGDATDVVTKEMYDFTDKGGRHVALRPEQTASVCRAFVEHRPTLPWKVWYAGPNFRYEKPQQGRYRQFDQVGVEALGVDDPALDVEVVALAVEFYRSLGLRGIEVRLNSIGDLDDRARFTEVLRTHLEEHRDRLSEEGRATLARNPLRLLDSKRPADVAVTEGAPRMSDFLSAGAAEHFADVRAGLDALGVGYVLDERLVRGLDYYRRTTFEFHGTSLTAAHTALGGGGRYDGLVESLGGPPTPGIGFALGLDRTLLACDAEGVFPAPDRRVSVFVVDTTGGREATTLCAALRAAGIGADRAFDDRSMKAQMRAADRSGAGIALIVGERERDSGTIVVRSMTTGDQTTIPAADVVAHVGRAIGGAA